MVLRLYTIFDSNRKKIITDKIIFIATSVEIVEKWQFDSCQKLYNFRDI